MSRPSSAAAAEDARISSEARGGPALPRARFRPPPLYRSVAAMDGQEGLPSGSLTHGLLRENAAVSGARTVSQARVQATATGPPPRGDHERRSKERSDSCRN